MKVSCSAVKIRRLEIGSFFTASAYGFTRKEYIFSANDFTLITVPPKIWYGFKSSNCEDSLILNLTDLLFNEKEILRKQIHEIGYDW